MKANLLVACLALCACQKSDRLELNSLRAEVVSIRGENATLREEAAVERRRVETYLADLHLRVESLTGDTTKLMDWRKEKVTSEGTDGMMGIAQMFAGSAQEAFGKEQAMWHAKHLIEVGFLDSEATARSLVDAFFKAALEERERE